MRVHVLPALGRRRLTELGPRDIKQLAADLTAKGLSANSVRLAIAPLKALLATAFEEELIRRNPAANVRLAQPERVDAAAQTPKALTPDQLRRLIASLPEGDRLLVELLAQTGLRIGELAALTWRDIDFGRRRLHVRRRWYRGTFAPPKSEHGVRVVPLTPVTARRLWTLRGRDDQLVFSTSRGTPIDVTNFYNRVYKPAARAAGVPWATLHTLRHTCASVLFNKAGLNPKQVQAWLGHHAASFTLDTYVHLLDEDIQDAPAALDALLEGATGGQQDAPNCAELTARDSAPILSVQAVSSG
jgi:integrase